MAIPEGTYLGKIRGGELEMPSPLRRYCETQGWNLFRFVNCGPDRVAMQPIMPGDSAADFQSSLDPNGKLWLPAELRASLALNEQSVMMRVEQGEILIIVRNVFEALGFRPA